GGVSRATPNRQVPRTIRALLRAWIRCSRVARGGDTGNLLLEGEPRDNRALSARPLILHDDSTSDYQRPDLTRRSAPRFLATRPRARPEVLVPGGTGQCPARTACPEAATERTCCRHRPMA